MAEPELEKMTLPQADLVERLSARPESVLVIVGSGVSVASTRNAPMASWGGLLEDGVDYCLDRLGLSQEWAKLRLDQLRLNEFVEVASEISKKLEAPTSALYADWLQRSVGSLVASEPGSVLALAAWGAPIATTNYDTLITQLTGLEPITWQDRAWLAQFFDGDNKKVLHLHGVHHRPETVVLGSRSYEDVTRDRLIQDVMKALVIGKTLVFVGCGTGGLNDPNMGGLIRWYREVLRETIRPSFLLARTRDKEDWLRQLSGSQIRIVTYGEDHADLPAFLEQIAIDVRRNRQPEHPFDDLVKAQPTFDQQVKEVLSVKDGLGPGEAMRRLMKLVRTHLEAGGRRSAWMAASGRMRLEGKLLQTEERIRFGIELAEIMFADGEPNQAFETLREILPDIESNQASTERRYQYWELQSRCLQALGPYEDTRLALERAIESSPDDSTRLILEAELAEVHYLRGDDEQTPAASPDRGGGGT